MLSLAENFIQRWGTHYIKSSKFGGQLQIRKFMDASDVSSKKGVCRRDGDGV